MARTSIKLLASVGEGAAVVHRDLVALLRLAVAVDLVGDFNLELIGGDGDGGKGRNGGEDGGGFHGCGGCGMMRGGEAGDQDGDGGAEMVELARLPHCPKHSRSPAFASPQLLARRLEVAEMTRCALPP